MHLDTDVEGMHVRFADMGGRFLDARTEYQLRIVQEDKNGRLYITDPTVPQYSENALLEYAMEHAKRNRKSSPEDSLNQTDRIPAPDKH